MVDYFGDILWNLGELRVRFTRDGEVKELQGKEDSELIVIDNERLQKLLHENQQLASIQMILPSTQGSDFLLHSIEWVSDNN